MARTLAFALYIFAGTFFGNPLSAQTAVWRIDSVNSTARLYVASTSRHGARINVGVARLSGQVLQNADSPLPGTFAFQIYPADKNARTVQPKGKGSVPPGANKASSTLIVFRSKRVELLDAKTLRVRGDLTATYASRDAVKREAIFVFRTKANVVTQEARQVNMEWSASSVIASEAFPELWNAIVTTNWPAFVLGENCAVPSDVGEDFSGPECKGKVVEPVPRTDTHCGMPSEFGEDFTGVVCDGTPLSAVPKSESAHSVGAGQGGGSSEQTMANEVVIELKVKLVRVNSAPPKSPTMPRDPTASNYGGVEVAAAGILHPAAQR